MTTLDAQTTATILKTLEAANLDCAARFPGESGDRQPDHTGYGVV